MGPLVVWSSPLFNRSSIAEEARNAILALDSVGVRVRANALPPVPLATSLPTAIEARLKALALREEPDYPFVHVMHGTPGMLHRHPRAMRHVARVMLETATVPAEWAQQLQQMDDIWVPCSFNVDLFAEAGVPAHVLHAVPEALQAELYDPAVMPLELPGATGFIFLSVFGWTRRKGWDVLIRAFLEEFRRDEPVTLALKISPYWNRSVPDAVASLRSFVRDELGREPAGAPRIVVIEFELAAADVPRLYAAADAFVLPSRGEGWGRPYMEAMAMGLPTIGTRWSGNLDFMNDDNSYLVDFRLVPVSEEACRERSFLRGHRWAEPSVEHLRALMRRVLDHPSEARAKGQRARADILARYAWRPVGERMAELLAR